MNLNHPVCSIRITPNVPSVTCMPVWSLNICEHVWRIRFTSACPLWGLSCGTSGLISKVCNPQVACNISWPLINAIYNNKDLDVLVKRQRPALNCQLKLTELRCWGQWEHHKNRSSAEFPQFTYHILQTLRNKFGPRLSRNYMIILVLFFFQGKWNFKKCFRWNHKSHISQKRVISRFTFIHPFIKFKSCSPSLHFKKFSLG